ncbi:MAG: glycosyltransferase family 4 protein [Timaviella obliquedivisa GSE-PSE-MK23-08B]|nr:glycosyltransferase family 4 protein [Timaviella obliquedivisa GSE-PSE-MK23-08B]
MAALDHVALTHPDTATDAALRVLFVSHTYVVGINQGKLNAIAPASSQSSSLQSIAPAITVGLLAPSNWKSLEWNRTLPLESPYPQLKIYAAPVALTGRGGAHFYAPWRVWQVLRDFQPHLIQVEEEVFSLCALEFAIWSRLTQMPLVFFGWENQARSLPLLRRWIRQFVLSTASLVIAGNHDGADLLHQWGYRGLIEVMPQMGVDPELFHPITAPAVEPDPPEFRIGYLGRLVPEKGIDTLLTALHQLRSQSLNCRLILCGSGSSETALKKIAQDQRISEWVTWQGAIPHHQAPSVMSQFDVLVLPSRTTPTWKEQFGHVLIEAMAMGIPVIGSDSGEIPNVIGRPDLIFPEDNALALTRILQDLIENPAWRTKIQQYCLLRVQQHYTHDRIAQKLMTLWRKILRQGGNL